MFQDENDIKDLPKLESNFNEKLARKKAKKELKKEERRKNKESSSCDSNSVSVDSSSLESLSSFDSEASRINFWKDINTKDEDYGSTAVFMKTKQPTEEKPLHKH
jgi:hypothetical protein